mmetsp:Transcript_18777/g.43449  ORF Transcript_18777/g.43449 Transcript_18777/m.43449 type:complete len:235 (-) Transcript_18777:840-1544(-)
MRESPLLLAVGGARDDPRSTRTESTFFSARAKAVLHPAIPPPTISVSVFLVFSSIHSGKVFPMGSPLRDGTTSGVMPSMRFEFFSESSTMLRAFFWLRPRIHPYIRVGSTVWYRSMSYHSTESARMAPALEMLSGTWKTPRSAKIDFAWAVAKGELVAPVQNRTPSGKLAATSSVMAREFAHGTRKSHGVEAQSSIGTHPSMPEAPSRMSQVCTFLAPNRTSSLATVDPTFPHP